MRIIPFAQELNTNIAGVSGKSFDPSISGSFAEELKNKIMEVDEAQHTANSAMEEGAVDGARNIHETMIKIEEADVSLRLLSKVRGKAIEAYHEIMRMSF